MNEGAGEFAEALREMLRSASGRIALLKRSAPFLVLVGVAIWLSTINLGDGAQAQSFEGSLLPGLLSWIAVFWVGTIIVGRLRREGARLARLRRTELEGAPPAAIAAARPIPGPSVAGVVSGVGQKAAVLIAGAGALIMLFLPFGWWSSATSAIRAVLEALPLGSAVAVTPAEHGNPWLVAALTGLFVLFAIFAASGWRLGAMRGYLYGGTDFMILFFIGLIRTVAIFGGLTLVPVVAVIAAGTDLREEPSYTFTGPVWPILVVLAWCAFDFVTLQRLHDREARIPPGSA